MKLSVLIPVYNEEHTIEAVIKKIKFIKLPYNMTKEIIIVNDGSTDGTLGILEQYSTDPIVRIFYQTKHSGKASALILGIKNSSGDIILIQDADLEYSPDDYPSLIEPIVKGETEVVYGSRFKGKIEKMKTINKIANIISNITLNLLFNTKISDVNTCYKVFKKDVLKNIRLNSNNFVFETEITAKLLKAGYKIREVPIRYVARSKEEGKKMNWFHALTMYWGMIKYRFMNDGK